jgi:mRNA degradation ribonuclease J1/J2
MSKKNKLRIIPLGGLGEVGKNMTVYECDGDILIVDTGIMFPENDMLGIDYIIPISIISWAKPIAWSGLSSRMVMKTTSARSITF